MENQKEWIVNTLSELISRNSVNPVSNGPGEAKKAEYIKELLEQWNFKPRMYEVTDAKNVVRPSIVVDVAGKEQTKTVWIIAHTDTVSEGDRSKWETDPFELKVQDEKVIGRGVNDNGIGLIAALLLLKKIAEEKVLPRYNLKIAFVADEEAGSEYGLKWLLDNTNEFQPNDVALVPDAGNLKGTMVEIAEKGILWAKISVFGKQVHASRPNLGINAHYWAMKFHTELYKQLYSTFNAENSLFTPNKSTFEPTKKEKNTDSINILPGSDIVYWDCRILPEYTVNQVFDFIKDFADNFNRQHGLNGITVEMDVHEEASFVDKNSWIVTELLTSIKSVLGVAPRVEGIGGGTFAGILRKKGIDAVVWSKQNEDSAHQPNEFEFIQNFIDTAKVFEKLLF